MAAHIELQKPLTSRRIRKPKHDFQTVVKPWQIQPCIFAPVLAGESLKNALFQVRAISDPVKNKVTGAWFETYLFYVKFGQLALADDLREMMITPAYDASALETAGASTYLQRAANMIDYQGQCMDAIIRAHFRDDGEDPSDYTVDSVPSCSVGSRSWVDSLHEMADLPAETGADDWEKKYNIWLGMSKAKFTTATFEEWLAMNGVTTPQKLIETEADFKIPELLRYSREFVYPVAAVEPSTGVVASLFQWSIADRADKARFFPEPGFLVGVTVVRPKVYRKNYKSTAINYLTSAERWVPSIYDTDPHASIFKFEDEATQADTPITGATADYYLDMKDLFIHGDQFLNFAKTATDKSIVALPSADASNTNYPSQTDADGLFVSATANEVYIDGTCTFSIATRLTDSTS